MCPVLIGRCVMLFACACSFPTCARDFISMQCLHPIPAWQHGLTKNGKPHYVFTPDDRDVVRLGSADCDVFLPCGKCIACQYNRRVNWSKRLMCEYHANSESSFITLTYNSDCLPDGVPDKHDLQCFLKRLRHVTRDFGIPLRDGKIRYFCCLELGKKTQRPHYHGVIFGLDFLRDEFQPCVFDVKDGHPLFTSPILEKIWSKGYVSVDRVTPKVCNYVTKYILKQMDDKRLWFIYSRGLGDSLFIQNNRLTPLAQSGYSLGFVEFGGDGKYFRAPIPRNIDRKLETIDPDLYATLKAQRREFLKLEKTDKRSATERFAATLSRLRQEDERRLLDEQT